MGIIMIYPKSIWSFSYEKFRQLKISTKAFLSFDFEKIIIFEIDLKDPPQYYTDQGVTAQKVWLAERRKIVALVIGQLMRFLQKMLPVPNVLYKLLFWLNRRALSFFIVRAADPWISDFFWFTTNQSFVPVNSVPPHNLMCPLSSPFNFFKFSPFSPNLLFSLRLSIYLEVIDLTHSRLKLKFLGALPSRNLWQKSSNY